MDRIGCVKGGELEDVHTREERATIRKVLGIGTAVEVGFVLFDLYTTRVVSPGASIAWVVGLRLLISLIVALGYVAAGRPMSLAVLRPMTLGIFVCAGITIALQATDLGGLNSRYLHGVWIVAFYYITSFPMPWRKAAPCGLAIIATFPVVLGAAALADERLWAQWRNAHAVRLFAEEYLFVVATVVLGATSSHATWDSRRRLVEEEQRQALKRQSAELSMEMHDGVSAALVRALAHLDAPAGGERLEMVRAAIEDGLREARGMMAALAAPPSKWGDVVADARREFEETCERAGVEATFHGGGAEDLVLPTELAHDMRRIVREATTNIVRHAAARTASCSCEIVDGAIRVCVEDDGRGLSGAPGGRGLSIIARRAQRHGGQSKVEQRPDGGVRLVAVLPVRDRVRAGRAVEVER
jgi:signal transduction histidine kinase